jgi:5-(hydroxymethyl)furfural/furfural oxidase
MKSAFLQMAEFFAAPSMKQAASDPFAAIHGAMAAMVGKMNWRNWLVTLPPALALDGPSAVRRQVIRRLLAPGQNLAAALEDSDALDELVRRHTIGGWHASGTCRMGSRDDRLAVTDPRDAQVYGLGGLRVVDASIMPTVPRANTNIPTIMTAEKMAAAILASNSMRG